MSATLVEYRRRGSGRIIAIAIAVPRCLNGRCGMQRQIEADVRLIRRRYNVDDRRLSWLHHSASYQIQQLRCWRSAAADAERPAMSGYRSKALS